MNIQDAEVLLSKVTPGSWKVDGVSLEAEFEDGARISIAEIKQMRGWGAVWEPGANGELFAKARGTLAVANELAKALGIRHNANPVRATDGTDKNAHHDACRGCMALAEWEKL